MNTSTIPSSDPFEYGRISPTTPANAISWAAILAGAAAAASLSLLLLMLGTGLGLLSVSPWAYNGVSVAALGASTIVWLAITQIIASGMGGFLAGRLRSRWMGVQTDEVYFRDTAHGFLAWAIATLATAALLTSVIGTIVSGGIATGDAVMDGGGQTNPLHIAKPEHEPFGYSIDMLFRKDLAGGARTIEPFTASVSPEVTRIFNHTLKTGPLARDDKRYVGQMVAAHTGLPQQDAENRVEIAYAQLQAKSLAEESDAKSLADAARKASIYASLWLFISLLIGAFIASFAAIYGGRMRDL